MEIPNTTRRCSVNWSDLPIEVIHSIAGFLSKTNDLLNFGIVCKEWHRAVQISTFLPHTLAFDNSKKLISSSIFILTPPNPTEIFPWMVLVSETTPGKIQYFSPFSRALISRSPETFDHNQWKPTKLATTFHIVANDNSQTPFSSHFGVYTKLSRVCPLVRSIDHYSLLSLSDEGKVNEIWPFGKKDRSALTVSKEEEINDIVGYKRKTYALHKSGELLEFGMNYYNRHHRCPISKGRGMKARRKRLVVSSSGDKLYLIVPISLKGSLPTSATRLQLIVYKLREYKTNSWVWSEVDNFGDSDQVLFISRDFCFFVAAAKFPKFKLKNRIVFSDDAFPICSTPWDYEGKIGNHFSVFKLDEDRQYSLPSTAYLGFQDIFSTFAPCWVVLNAYSRIQSQSQRILDAKRMFRDSLGNNSSTKGDQDKEVLVDSSNDKHCKSEKILQDEAVREYNKVHVRTSKMNNHKNGGDLGPDFSKEKVSSDANSTPVAATVLKQNKARCSVTVNFEGVEINSELLRTLQAIWLKFGSPIGKETVRSKPILACVLESLARLIITLQNTTGRSLTDTIVDDISSTFSDLQRAGLKVNWLAPTVEKALNLHKSKPEIESIMLKSKRKAQIDKEVREFLARTTKEKQELEDDIANLRARIPFPTELIDLDDKLGKELLPSFRSYFWLLRGMFGSSN
ncbi:unnamed protein product [Amaranthus hypochondriacus]